MVHFETRLDGHLELFSSGLDLRLRCREPRAGEGHALLPELPGGHLAGEYGAQTPLSRNRSGLEHVFSSQEIVSAAGRSIS